MERVVRTLLIEGHRVSVVEAMEEEGPGFLLCVDGAIVNADAALPDVPSDEEIRAALARWSVP